MEYAEPDFALNDLSVTTATLLKIARELFGDSAPGMGTDTIINIDSFDDLRLTQYLSRVAEGFGVRFPMEEIDRLKTVSDLATLLHEGELPGLRRGESAFYSREERHSRDF